MGILDDDNVESVTVTASDGGTEEKKGSANEADDDAAVQKKALRDVESFLLLFIVVDDDVVVDVVVVRGDGKPDGPTRPWTGRTPQIALAVTVNTNASFIILDRILTIFITEV